MDAFVAISVVTMLLLTGDTLLEIAMQTQWRHYRHCRNHRHWRHCRSELRTVTKP